MRATYPARLIRLDMNIIFDKVRITRLLVQFFQPSIMSTLFGPHILFSIPYLSEYRRPSFCTEWLQALPEFDLLLISSWIKFWFVAVVPKYFNFATF
jgi:hypothetical protein